MHHILNARADTHKDFCEDAYYYTERDGWVICGVFDGCSDGINSHFASQLHAYSFRLAIENHWTDNLQDFTRGNATTDDLILTFSSIMTACVVAIRGALDTTELENLSTAAILLYDVNKEYLIAKFMGDGVLRVNDTMHRITSGVRNEPNYVGYLGINDAPDIVDILDDEDKYPTIISTNAKSFSLCTDGIDAIKHPHRPLEEVHHYLLENKDLSTSKAALRRKLNILRKEGCILEDDLTIIRYGTI